MFVQNVMYLVDNVTFLQLLLYTGDALLPHYTCYYTYVTYRDNACTIPYDSWNFSYNIICLSSWRYTWPRTRRDATARDDRSRTHARVTCLPPRRDARTQCHATMKRRMYLLHLQIHSQASSFLLLLYFVTMRWRRKDTFVRTSSNHVSWLRQIDNANGRKT